MYYFSSDDCRVALTTAIAQHSKVELLNPCFLAVARHGNLTLSSPQRAFIVAEAWQNIIYLLNSSVSMVLGQVVSKRHIRRAPKAEGGFSKKGKIVPCKGNLPKKIGWLLQTMGPVEARQLLRLLGQAVHAQTTHLGRRKDVLLEHVERALISQVSLLLTYVEPCQPLVGKCLVQSEIKFDQHLRSKEGKRTSSQSAGSPPNWQIKIPYSTKFGATKMDKANQPTAAHRAGEEVKISPYSDTVCDTILTRVLNRYLPHINAFAVNRLRPEMREKFTSGVIMALNKMIRRGVPPFDQCVVEGRIDWHKFGPRIYGILKKRMEWDRKSHFDAYHKKLNAFKEAANHPPPDPYFEAVEPSTEDDLEERWSSHEEIVDDLTQILQFLVDQKVINDLEKQAFLLHVVEELTFVQVGQRIGRSKTTAERRYKSVKEALESEGIREQVRMHFDGDEHE